jgi:ketosteroid isomerase-like protein
MTGGVEMTRRALLFCLPVVLLCSACTAVEEVQVSDELPEGLRETIDAFYSSVESADVEARIALFADDVIMMPNHWTMSRGKEDVAAVFRASAGAVFQIRDREVVKASVSGDLAYTVNSYYYTYHAAEDEPQWHKTKNIHIWRRDADGLWKLQADIWNSDVPISAFADE